MNEIDFKKNALMYKDFQNNFSLYKKKHKLLSHFISNLFNLSTLTIVILLCVTEKYSSLLYIFIFYFLFLIIKESLLNSYLKKSFKILINIEKKHGFLTKSINNYNYLFNKNELIFIKYQISLIDKEKKFSWNQLNDYLKILKLISSK